MLFSAPMLFFQEDPAAVTGAGGWLPEASFWLALATLLVAGVVAAGVWTLVLRLTDLRRESERLRSLADIQAALERLVADRDDLDLRRIEHVLIDVRDGSRRLEDALLRFVEVARGAGNGAVGSELVPARPDVLAERVTNRLLALGYERVQIVTRAEKLLELGAKDGEVLVEARRSGVLHKGRVLVRGGQLSEVEMNPAYSIFP